MHFITNKIIIKLVFTFFYAGLHYVNYTKKFFLKIKLNFLNNIVNFESI